MPRLSVEGCGSALYCRFIKVDGESYRRKRIGPPFECAMVRLRPGGGSVTLELARAPVQRFLAQRSAGLGEPEDVEIVSHPLAEPPGVERPADMGVSWDSKYSDRMTLNSGSVWFGYEVFGGVTRLVDLRVYFGDSDFDDGEELQ